MKVSMASAKPPNHGSMTPCVRASAARNVPAASPVHTTTAVANIRRGDLASCLRAASVIAGPLL